MAVPFSVTIGVDFLVSPVVQALGMGLFGVDFRWRFAATVLATSKTPPHRKAPKRSGSRFSGASETRSDSIFETSRQPGNIL